MTSFWSFYHLLVVLFALAPCGQCSPANYPLHKRAVDETTPLYELTHLKVDRWDYKVTVLETDKKEWKANSVYWGSNRRVLATLGEGNVALSVQSNVGGWICEIGVDLGYVLSRYPTSSERYKKFWSNGCGKALLEKLKEWEEALQTSAQVLGQEEKIPLRIVGSQVFALSAGGKPLGAGYRPFVVPEMMDMFKNDTSHPREVEINHVSLVGWPGVKSGHGGDEYGFVVVQDGLNKHDGSSIKIYSSGNGARNPGFNNNPGYGTRPAITINLAGGLPIQTCSADLDYWIFNVDQKSSAEFDKDSVDAAVKKPVSN